MHNRTKALVAFIGALIVGLVLWSTTGSNRADHARVVRRSPDSAARPDGPAPGAVIEGLPGPETEIPDGGLLCFVTRARDGAPVGGAQIRWHDPGGGFDDAIATSNESGTARIEERRDGAVYTFAAGYRPARVDVTADQARVDIRLEDGASISGRVVTTNGRPVPGARVWAHAPGNLVAWPNDAALLPSRGPAGNYTTADADGIFQIEGLADSTFMLRARANGFGQTDWVAPSFVAAGTSAVTIVMEPVYRVEVVVRDRRTGEFPPGTSVMFSSKPGTFSSTADIGREAASEDAPPIGLDRKGVMRIALTKTKGSTGELKLFVVAPGYERAVHELRVQKPVTRVEMKLDAAVSGRRGQLVVSAAFAGSGLRFAGRLQCQIRGATGNGMMTIEFRNGEATQPIPLPAGRYRIEASGTGDVGTFWRPAGASQQFEIREEAKSNVALELKGTLIDLVVLDPQGIPVRGYDIRLGYGMLARWDTPANHADHVRWRPGYAGPDLILPPGMMKLSATIPHVGRSATAVIDAKGAGERTTVTLRLEAEAK